ncbi:MAG: hypothetical protein K0R28_6291 [Paenibacillus sp.]|nr:hypothetical protein [Paenibacillus sp.]
MHLLQFRLNEKEPDNLSGPCTLFFGIGLFEINDFAYPNMQLFPMGYKCNMIDKYVIQRSFEFSDRCHNANHLASVHRQMFNQFWLHFCNVHDCFWQYCGFRWLDRLYGLVSVERLVGNRWIRVAIYVPVHGVLLLRLYVINTTIRYDRCPSHVPNDYN